MAVSFDAVGPSSAGAFSTGATTLSWTHTNSGAGVALTAWGSFHDTATAGKTMSCALDPAGANTAFTTIGGPLRSGSDGGDAGFGQMWGLPNTTSGAHTIKITASAIPSDALLGGSTSFSGADLASPFGTAQTNQNAVISTSHAITFTGSTTGNRITAGVVCGAGFDASQPTGATKRWEEDNSNTTRAGNAAQADAAGGGSVTITWTTTTAGQDWHAIVAVEVKVPSGGAGAQTQPGGISFRSRYRRVQQQAGNATVFTTAATPPPPQTITSRRRPSPRPRSFLAAGFRPSQLGSRFTNASQRSIRASAPRRPRSFILTGMTPGSGVAFVPPPTPYVQTDRRQPGYRPRSTIASGYRPSQLGATFTRSRRIDLRRPRSYIAAGNYRLPILGATFTRSRIAPARRPRSTIAAGFWPPARGYGFLAATRRPAPLRRRGLITGTLVPAFVAPSVTVVPGAIQTARRQPARRPRSYILTGMTPGSGVPFVPPPTPYVIARRRQPDKRPLHLVTGPLAPGTGVAAIPVVPAWLRASKRTGAGHPRSIISIGRTPGAGTAFVQPSIFIASRRQPVKRPRGYIATGYPPRILGYTFIRSRVVTAQRKRGLLSGPLSPATVVVVTPIVPALFHATRKYAIIRPRPVIRTGMTPGLGVAFVPPAPPRVVAIRRQPDRKARPRSFITGLKVFPVLFPPGLEFLSGTVRADIYAGTGTHDTMWGENNPQTYGGSVSKDKTGGSVTTDDLGGAEVQHP